ncbi:unnamed protein product [Arabis nemorensis]|uniref:F-box domain-containing protein n=1 Tax=Arabis nemorensis TaxID=586526 RepID=A0A565C8W4_9BRAS|nr:unnamed protein product [Arabis nemorensis]
MLSPPHEKMKLDPSPPPSLSILSVPNEVALEYLSLVSRSDHAALCAVSRSYRSLVGSPHLYEIRSLMGRTETYVYVCIRAPPPGPSPRWYILRRRETSSDLIPIPSLPSQAQESSSVVVVDWGIYVIGGLTKGKATSDVFLLDCRTHKWRQVPSMRLARANAAAGVVDGKIYVLGGCKFDSGELFDPKTQTWDSLKPFPEELELHGRYIHDSFVRDQKVYAVCGKIDGTDTTFYYSPREDNWGRGNSRSSLGNARDWCRVGDLLYSISRDGTIYWCEPEELDWREPEGMVTKEVKGLDSLKKSLSCSRLIFFDHQNVHLWEQFRKVYNGTFRIPEVMDLLPGARLTTFGPNMLLFWSVLVGDRLQISCAEISLERQGQGDEVRGNIESTSVVLTVDPFDYGYKVLYSASVLV